jgi:hypothetical protein
MTAHASISADAANPTASCALQLGALDRLLDNPALRFTRAGTITQTQNAGELNAMIAKRCKRMAFRSNEARKRYLAVHRALAGDV